MDGKVEGVVYLYFYTIIKNARLSVSDGRGRGRSGRGRRTLSCCDAER